MEDSPLIFSVADSREYLPRAMTLLLGDSIVTSMPAVLGSFGWWEFGRYIH